MMRWLVTIFFLFSTILIVAENTIDSLNSLVQTASNEKKVDLYNEIATIYFSTSPAKAEEYAERAKNEALKIGDKKRIADSYKNLGKSYYFRGNFEKTLEYFKESLKFYNEIDDLEGISSSNNNIGIIYKNWGEYPKALQYFQRSLEIDESIGNNKGVAASLNNIGQIYLNWNNYEKALEYYRRSLQLKEDLKDEKGIASSLNNIGEIYFKWKNYDKALENYNKSLEIRIKLKDNNDIATSFHNIGEVYKRMENNELALEYYLKAFDLQEELGDKFGMSYSLNNIGEIHQRKKDFNKALDYYNYAIKIQLEIGKKRGLANSYHRVGSVYAENSNYDEAIRYFTMSSEIAQELNATDMTMQIFNSFSDVYESKGDFKNAYKYYKEYIYLKDSIFDYAKFAEITTKYETEKLEREKQIEIDKKQNEIERQKIIIWSAVLGAIVIFIFLSLLLRLFIQKRKAHRLLEKQKQEITDSILYARRIQQAVLPPDEYINETLKEFFILNLPRDIVSGDFYWTTRKEDKIVVAVADCTGHGVPGAFMSMLGISFLNEIVGESTDLIPGKILDELRDKIINSLHQKGITGEARDGMDISLCVFDFKNKKLSFSGANNPIYIINSSSIINEIKADKMPIGFVDINQRNFNTHELNINSGDIIYMFSDGFADQFGGLKNKKYKISRFKDLLIKHSFLPISKQKEMLEKEYFAWKGRYEQVDDILIMGIKIL